MRQADRATPTARLFARLLDVQRIARLSLRRLPAPTRRLPASARRVPALARRLPALAAAALLAAAGLAACDSDPSAPDADPVEVELDFTASSHGWEYGFSDFNVGWEENMELEGGHRPLPEPLTDQGYGLHVGATNRSDDVFMYWTGRVDGFEPDTRYQIDFRVEFATAAPSDCVGVGGPPGESVHLKVGATPERPEPVDDDGYWQMNIDKGNQLQGGDDAIRIGHVGNTVSECTDWVFEMKTVESEEPFTATTDADGALWFLVGTDSGFEARTELYYTRYEAVLREW